MNLSGPIFTMTAICVVAQAAPAPFDWGTYIFQTGGMGIALVVGYHLVHMNRQERVEREIRDAKRDRDERRARAILVTQFDAAMVQTKKVIVESVMQSTKVQTLLEQLLPHHQFDPSQSTQRTQDQMTAIWKELEDREAALNAKMEKLQSEEESDDKHIKDL